MQEKSTILPQKVYILCYNFPNNWLKILKFLVGVDNSVGDICTNFYQLYYFLDSIRLRLSVPFKRTSSFTMVTLGWNFVLF